MNGMEHAIEKAAKVLDAVDRNHDLDSGDLASSEEYARALAEAGLLAPAPLTEEWSAAFTGIAPDGTKHIHLIGTPGGREHAQETCDDCNADDPDVLFFLVRRPVHDWMPVNPAEDGGRAEP